MKNVKKLLLCFALLFANVVIAAPKIDKSSFPTQTPSTGKIDRVFIPSTYVADRPIDIWVPDGYPQGGDYDVIYMHDGQMLFDSSIAWNKQEWKVDEIVGALIAENKIEKCIVVGVWNIPDKRYADYFPQKAADNIPDSLLQAIAGNKLTSPFNADNYLKYLVTEVIPYVEKNYKVKTTADSRVVMGSSMGGLISLYALCEYPQLFMGAGCLSIHSPLIGVDKVDDNADNYVASKFREYLERSLPKANTKLIYMDYGNETLDAHYAPYQKRIDKIMQSKGWKYPYWETKFFPGANHSEDAWAQRLSIPLEFLLGTNK